MKHEVFLDLSDCLKILSFHMLLSLSHVPVEFALINLYALQHNWAPSLELPEDLYIHLLLYFVLLFSNCLSYIVLVA